MIGDGPGRNRLAGLAGRLLAMGGMTFVPKNPQPADPLLEDMEIRQDLIPEEECWELLASASVGRLALSLHALPAILPVQYYLDGRKLAVCLGHREIPVQTLNAVVAFAADAIDPLSRSGWSVQVQGRSVMSRRLAVDTTCGRPAAGQIVHIEPSAISGYRMHLCPFIDSLLAGPGDP